MALPPPDGRPPVAAPVAFIILAAAGATFFVLPLLGLLLRTPWASAWALLTSSASMTAGLSCRPMASPIRRRRKIGNKP